MNVIAPRTLRLFWHKHPRAEVPLKGWLKLMQSGSTTTFAELRSVHASADYLSELELTVFNVGGNSYRLVAFVRYEAQTVFVKRVLTHAEYDRWNAMGDRCDLE